MDKLTKDFLESNALFDELMNIYSKGKRALKNHLLNNNSFPINSSKIESSFNSEIKPE